MALNKRLISTGSPVCATETTDIFGDSSGVALYSLDYDASAANDQSSYDGTPTNVTFGVSGKTLYGARFNGSSSEIRASSFASLSQVGISMWVNMPDISQQAGLIARYGTNREFAIYMYSGNLTASIYYNGNNGNATTITTSTYMSNNTWHHIAYTANGSTAPKLYIDGSEVGTPQYTDAAKCAYYTSSEPLDIGHFANNSSYNYSGDIDQVRIFSRALSSSEVSTLWNNGDGEIACVHTATANTEDFPSGATAVAHYPLDNNSVDNKGTNDGTDTSGVEYRFGRYGQAAVFNGASHIDVDSLTSVFGGKNTVSVSLWFNTTTTARERIFSDYAQSSRNIDITIDGGNIDIVTDYGSATAINFISSADYNDGNWHHIVVAINQSTSQRKIFIDNTLLETATLPTPSWNGYDQHVTIGAIYAGGYGQYFNGKIDQVRVYSSAITNLQVTELYNEKPETDTSNFKTILYNGNGSTQYISNLGFEPDFVWIKKRGNDTKSHRLFDSVRGANNVIYSDLNNQAATPTNELTEFQANGFFVGNASAVNDSSTADSYVAWNWKAGGTPVTIGVNSITGSTPSIASTVSANPAAGFSIVRNTGTASYTDTIGHGLSQAPEIVIQKPLAANVSWYVLFNLDGTGGWDYASLNTTAAFGADNPVRFSANSTTINNWGWNGYDMINYCFHSVSGYSSIAAYQGVTGNKVITTGFRPSFVMIKNTSNAGNNWNIMDSRRDTSNPIELNLWADTSDTESTASQSNVYDVDFDNNGFTIKNNYSPFNANGQSYLYMAFK